MMATKKEKWNATHREPGQCGLDSQDMGPQDQCPLADMCPLAEGDLRITTYD